MNWEPFDIIGLDAFRGLRNAATHRDDLRKERAHGKPVAILEVGCCTFQGAGDYGGAGWYVAMEADGVTLKSDLVRDEGEQVRYVDDLMPIFDEEGIDSVSWFSFIDHRTPHRTNGAPDLDMASHGIVKLLEKDHGMPTSSRVYPVPRRAPRHLHADRGYDFDRYRRLPWNRGIRPMIAPRGVRPRLRTGQKCAGRSSTPSPGCTQFKRLSTRYERRADLHQGELKRLRQAQPTPAQPPEAAKNSLPSAATSTSASVPFSLTKQHPAP